MKAKVNSVVEIQNFPEGNQKINGQIARVDEAQDNFIIATTGTANFKLHVSQFKLLIP